MDGDIAPVPELLALCERHDAWLMLDDAHGFGVLGAHGRGVLEHFQVSSPRIIYMATLGKAAGVFGAFVAAEESVVQTLLQRARTYIYTTALPPLLACALMASLHLFREEGWRRGKLQSLIGELQNGLRTERWKLRPSLTPIQPLIVGDNRETVWLAETLRREGILVPAIRPPTVPKGQARLRISLSAGHSREDVRLLCEALNEASRSL